MALERFNTLLQGHTRPVSSMNPEISRLFFLPNHRNNWAIKIRISIAEVLDRLTEIMKNFLNLAYYPTMYSAFLLIYIVYRTKKDLLVKLLEKKRVDLPDETKLHWRDGHLIQGVDQDGNGLSVRFIVRQDLVAEVHVSVLINGATFTLPGGVKLYRVPKFQWKVKELQIEVLEPLRRLRVSFNGFLKHGSTIKYVRFNFIYTSAGEPQRLDLYSKDLFHQFGSLRGVIYTDNSDGHNLNLPACRTRFYHCDTSKEKTLFIAGRDGTLLELSSKSCNEVYSGCVISKTGTIFPINYTDFHLNDKAFTIRANNHTTEVRLRVNETSSCNYVNNFIDCMLDSVQAKAIFSTWTKHQGTLPPPLLLPKLGITESQLLSFRNSLAQNPKLSGGKGSSLALLSTLPSSSFHIPDGYVLTVNALRQHLNLNSSLKQAIANLVSVCCNHIEDDIEAACCELVKAFESTEVTSKEIQELLSEDTQWAVRSSGLSEDTEELSAAGQNKTFLGCKSSDVPKAICKCWGSLYSYQSVKYRIQYGLPVQSEMAVVIQKMIPADCAGVLFTCHPSNGDSSQMFLTANYGLGESVVSGRSEPDTVILGRSWDDNISLLSKTIGQKNLVVRMTESGTEEVPHDSTEFCINEDMCLKLGRVGVLLENAFSGARDIEWGFYKDQLYIFQSRPVTTQHAWSDEELLHEFDAETVTNDVVYTVANTGEVFPGANTTLSITTIGKSVEMTMQLGNTGRVDRCSSKCLPIFQRHVFLDVINTINRMPSKENGIKSKIVDLAVFGRPVTVTDDRIKSIAIERFGLGSDLQILLQTIFSASKAWNNDRNIEQMRKKVSQLSVGIEPGDSCLVMHTKINDFLYGDLIKYLNYHNEISGTSIFYQFLATSILVGSNKEITMEHYNDFAEISSSCNDVISAEIPKSLEGIVDNLTKHGQAENFTQIDPTLGQSWLQTHCVEAFQLFEQFLKDHGHRAIGEFDIGRTPWKQNPSQVISMIQANCSRNVRTSRPPKTIEETIESLKSPMTSFTKTLLRFLLVRYRKAVGGREKSKCEAVRLTDKCRQAYRELARKMVEEGLIPSENLIFHLAHYEVRQVIERRSNAPLLLAKAMRRQKLHAGWDKIRFPELSYGIPKAEEETVAVLVSDRVVKGTPICSGSIQGRACVVSGLDEISQLQNGDILITYSTDIGWSPYFPIIGGLVTELGGLISHGAVVARECGLPTIVGAKGATKMFKTGDTVQLCSKTGSLKLISDAGS